MILLRQDLQHLKLNVLTSNEKFYLTKMSDTTTRFKGDIQFKIGDATRKGSQLLTLGDLDNYVQTGHLFNEVEGLPEVDIKIKIYSMYHLSLQQQLTISLSLLICLKTS